MKKILLVSLVALLAVGTVYSLGAINGKDASDGGVMSLDKKRADSYRGQELRNLMSAGQIGEESKVAQVVIWEDDMEGADWTPDASWGTVAVGGGYAFPTTSRWAAATDNYFSATTSYHISDVVSGPADETDLDFVISPVFYLPDSVTDAGVTTPLKLANLYYAVDSDGGTSFWTHVGFADATWHSSTSGPITGTASWVMVQSDLAHERQWLITGDIDLAGTTAPELTFNHAFVTEGDWDYCSVDISDDDFQSYTSLGSWSGDVDTVAAENIDLTAFAGDTIAIRFRFASDYAYTEGGAYWQVDDISVDDGATNLYADDGGETAGDLTFGGFISGGSLIGYAGANNPAPAWYSPRAGGSVFAGGGGMVAPGDSIRVAVQFISTEGAVSSARGLYVDDFYIEGIGTLPQDVSLSRVENIKVLPLNEEANFIWIVENVGLNAVTDRLEVTADIYNSAGVRVATARNVANVTDFLPGEVLEFEANPLLNWTPLEPDEYDIVARVNYAADGFDANNQLEYTSHVFDGGYSGALYFEDFVPVRDEESLEAFGWEVIAPEVDTTNDNNWFHDEQWPGYGAYIDGWYTYQAPWLEDLDEFAVSPPIDISTVGPNNRLLLEFVLYWRIGLFLDPAMGADSTLYQFTFEGSNDGENWSEIYQISHQDTAWFDYYPSEANPEGDRVYGYLGFDISEFNDGGTLFLRAHFTAENSNIFRVYFSDVLVYQGVGKAYITGVDDIPDDQGGQVRVSWMSSGNDNTLLGDSGDEFALTQYSLWREVPVAVAGASEKPVTKVSDFDELVLVSDGAAPEARFEVADEGFFDFIVAVPVLDIDEYAYVAPTLYDFEPSVFGVIAHTADPYVYSRSELEGGASTDDLAPARPLGLDAIYEDGVARLSWEAGEEDDKTFETFLVYRGTTSDFTPDEAIGTTENVSFDDATVEEGNTYYYVIAARDFGGNVSELSGVVGLVATGIEDENGIPEEFAISQNYPNPFNPSTNISYQLPEAATVTLVVYDILGKEVAILVNGQKPAGNHIAVWNGENNAGQQVTTGVYFYRITAGDFTAIKKMVLMK